MGIISTVAGTGEKSYGGDGGPATAAKLGGIYCAAFDPKGEQLYLADLHNYRVRRLDLKTGTIHLVAGNGKRGVPADGATAAAAPLADPRAVAVDRKNWLSARERCRRQHRGRVAYVHAELQMQRPDLFA